MEIAVIIILACVCLWLAWRLNYLRKGIDELTEALKSDPLPEQKALQPAAWQASLTRLKKAAYDCVSEAQLQMEVAEGRRKILDYVLNQIEDAIFIVDDQQDVFFANAASSKLCGNSESLVGRQLIEACLDHRLAETVALAMDTGTRMQDRIELANTSKILFVEAEPLDPALKLGAGAWVLLRDITDELQTEQIRKDFVANASHELRTPLSIIKGHLEMLADEVDNPTIDVLSKHTDRITRLVEDMLMISKLENSEGSDQLLNKELFDLGDCVSGVVEQLRPLIEEHDTTVTIDLPKKAQHRQIFGDRFYFDQILFNLVENALKQNQKPGLKITIRLRRSKSSGQIKLDIVDNGVGIPSADLDAVFKRFYRVDKQHSQAVKGTGLGLSIVKRAVEAHHGSISVTSQPGQQTSFSISLPSPPATVANPLSEEA